MASRHHAIISVTTGRQVGCSFGDYLGCDPERPLIRFKRIPESRCPHCNGTMTRLEAANKWLQVIASCGRQFFRWKDQVAWLSRDGRGRIWFVDHYSGKRIYTHQKGHWKRFSSGGTMKTLIECLRDFVAKGQALPARNGLTGPWPYWYCGGDLWGYGYDMERVRREGKKLGILKETKDEHQGLQEDAEGKNNGAGEGDLRKVSG
jgi:hypothetical protein